MGEAFDVLESGFELGVNLENAFGLMLGAGPAWRKLLLVLSAGLVFFASSLFAQQSNDSWVQVTSKDGSFSLLFPGQPKVSEEKVEHATTSAFVWAVRGERVFLAGETDYDFTPPVEAELVADRDNFLKALSAKVVTSKRFEYTRGPNDILPALEFTGESAEFAFKGVIILDGRRVYQVSAGGVGEMLIPIEKFINSLKLKPAQH